MKNILLATTLLITCLMVSAQQDEMKDENGAHEVNLVMSARSYGDSIVLRWGHNAHYAWREINRAGFQVERLALDKDNNVLNESFIKITEDPLKPWQLEEWKNKADTANAFQMLAAQTLHGKSFDVEGNVSELESMQNQAEEARSRFSFALFAADVSPVAANGLALRYVDKDIKPGDKYVYKVYSPVKSTLFTVDTAMFIIGTGDIYKPSRPVGLMAHENDGFITLTWPRGIEYTAFDIERSGDEGKSFIKLNELPYVRIAKGEGERNFVFVDSVENYKKYSYRVKGVSSFGDYSKWSKPVTAMGRDRTPPSIPTVISTENIAEGKVKITWEMNKVNHDLKGFYIGRSKNVGGPFNPLNEEALAKSTREYIDDNAVQGGMNYYIVASIDTALNIAQSAPAYTIMPDNSPPARPVGLEGKIDTTGVVFLNWELGQEMDLKGYRVYYSNTSSEDEDYMILTKEPLKANSFQDTVTLNTLNEKIYYRLVAVDMNLNNSNFSETLVLEKPDTIKPVAPVFENYQASDTAVYMEWVNGSSKDIVKQLLYRKAGIGNWIMLEEFEKEAGSFTDEDVLPGIGYQYALVSVDDAGLTSMMSKPLTVKIMHKGITGSVDGFGVSYDEENNTVKLKWNKGDRKDCNFIIYRSYNGNGLKMLASASGANSSFEDKKIQGPGSYGYAIRAFYEDGTKSPMTTEKIIEVP